MCGGMVNVAEETAYVLSEATLRARVIVAGVGAGPWRELRAIRVPSLSHIRDRPRVF